MKTHDLKILPNYFNAQITGNKPWELREDDRDFEVHDILRLKEWTQKTGYTGNECSVVVKYMLKGNKYGLKKGFVIMTTEILKIRQVTHNN